MELFAWTLVFFALFGAFVNSHGKYLISFQIWTFTNLFLSILNFCNKNHAQGFLFFAYLITSIHGWYKTKNKKAEKACKSRTQKHEKTAKTPEENIKKEN